MFISFGSSMPFWQEWSGQDMAREYSKDNHQIELFKLSDPSITILVSIEAYYINKEDSTAMINTRKRRVTLEIVNAGLHCSFKMSKQMLPLLLMFGWKTFVLKATCRSHTLHKLANHRIWHLMLINLWSRQLDLEYWCSSETHILHI